MTDPTPPAPPAEPPANPTTPPATDDGLGDAGKKALETERAARKELERQIKELQARPDPVKAIAEALGVKPADAKTDDLAATVKQMQAELAQERAGRLRAEIAAAKGLPQALAARLQGGTREELEADAEALKALIPAAATTTTPGTPAPDPSQGARGGANDLHAAIAAAEQKGDVMEAIRLKGRLVEEARAKQ